MSRVKPFLQKIILVVFAMFPIIGFAGTQQGLEWLGAQIQADGSIARVSDVANTFQSTEEALSAFASTDRLAAIDKLAIYNYLVGEQASFSNAERLARLIRAGVTVGIDITVPLTTLKTLQLTSGGFSSIAGGDSNVLATLYALSALGAVGETDADTTGIALGYLQAQQNPDGGFGLTETNPGSVYLTALVSTAMQTFRLNYNIDANIASASAFLQSSKVTANAWATPWESALSLRALIGASTDSSTYADALLDLQAAQNPDGSWNADVYATALAVQVLETSANVVLPEPDTNGDVTGLVVNSETGTPLSGVIVSVDTVPATSIVSDANGEYLIANLIPGNYIASYTSAGYLGGTQAVTVTASQVVNLSTTAMTPVGNNARITGTITSFETGLPLADVVITVGGTTAAMSATNANGYFSLNIAPGSFTIDASLVGFDSVGGSGSAGTGATVDFSVVMRSTGTTPADPSVTLQGRVIDAATGAPIGGAQISIPDQLLSVNSAGNGTYALTGIASGQLTVKISAPGFLSALFDAVAPGSATLDAGDTGLATSPVGTAAIQGNIVDGSTGVALSGAVVAVENQGLSVASGANGAFLLAGILPGSFILDVSIDGYYTLRLQVNATAGAVANLAVVPLQPIESQAASSVSGIVIDSDTGSPIAGASVSVLDTVLSSITDSQGAYTIGGIPAPTNIVVSVGASGYITRIVTINSATASDLDINVALQSAVSGAISIPILTTDQSNYGAYNDVSFFLQVGNQQTVADRVDVIAKVRGVNGLTVDTIVIADDSPEGLALFLAPSSIIDVAFNWSTSNYPPGNYVADVSVYDSVSGQIVAQQSAGFTIEPTQAIGSVVLGSTPRFLNVGAIVDVSLVAVVNNASNVATSFNLIYTLKDPESVTLASGTVPFVLDPSDRVVSATLQKVNQEFLKSGVYLLSGSTDFAEAIGNVIPGAISVAPSVRIEPKQLVSPMKVFPDGDKLISITIRLEGVAQ